MKMLSDAKKFLNAVGMPEKQQSDIAGYTLLALAQLTDKIDWHDAMNDWIRIHDIMQFLKVNYKIEYAENSRETFRKQVLHHFRMAAIVEDNGKSTNSPLYSYRLTNEAVALVRNFKSAAWNDKLAEFISEHEILIRLYESKKKMQKMSVNINNTEYSFSGGKHNELQKAILEEFAPRFAVNAECLYVGDTTDKGLVKNIKEMKSLGFSITSHNKMPDVVLYCKDKQWLYFIEAVTSVGPINPKRIIEINEMTKNVAAGKVFVTAFLNLDTYKKFVKELAWETEVWIAEMPEHMIHLNGDRFLGPR